MKRVDRRWTRRGKMQVGEDERRLHRRSAAQASQKPVALSRHFLSARDDDIVARNILMHAGVGGRDTFDRVDDVGARRDALESTITPAVCLRSLLTDEC